jgi:hypothetical protein
MSSLLNLSYWFSLRPIPFVPAMERGLIIGFGIIFLLGVGAFLLLLKHGKTKTQKRIIQRFANTLTWIGILGALLWSFTYEGVMIFSMRFFFIPLAVWFCWDLVWLYRFLRIEVPRREQMMREREQKNKWLPKRKK